MGGLGGQTGRLLGVLTYLVGGDYFLFFLLTYFFFYFHSFFLSFLNSLAIKSITDTGKISISAKIEICFTI